MKKIIYLLVGIVLFGGLYYSCAPEELPGSIYGTVVDKATGEPIKSAGVELNPSGLKTVTGSEGQFEFTELDPGKYTLIITKTGYIDGVSHTIEVKPGQQAKGDVQIEKLPPALKVVDDNRQEISTLDFGSAEDDVARSFSVFNDGTETLEWELTATADWIKSVSKTSGTLSAGATQSLIITIDRAKLSSGENKTTVHITSNSGNKQLVVTATNNFQVTKLNVLPTTAITSTSAILNGEIVEDGSPIYTERGFVYAETTQPTINACIQKIAAPFSDSKTFAATVSDLVEGKKYYVRAYAIQSGKEVYSANEVSFTAEGSVLPKVTTKSVTDISRSEGKAIAMGMVTEVGDPAYTERGFVYGTNHNPIVQTATKAIVEGNGVGEFVGTLSDLQLGNMYYVRAYALNTVGVAYGEEQTLDFNPILPVVATNDVTGLSEETQSATFHATITNAGDPVYTERGFVYGKSPDPTTGGATKVVVAGSGKGTYYGDVHNLELDCAYYVRAYVTYSLGTVYGENKMFSIKKTYLPTVITSAVTQITTTTAVAGGNVTDDGGSSVSERGVVYSTNQNPTIADNKIVSGSGLGDFICNLTNLQERTTYYVCAYAINSKGVTYGTQVEFTTQDSNTPVIPPTDGAIVFDADVDQGNASFDSNNSSEYVISKNGITMTVSNGIIYTYNNEMHYRIYKNQNLTLSSTVGNIAKIEFICTHENNEKYGPGCLTVSSGYYTYNGFVGTWLGSTNEITFTAATNQVRATQVIVTLDKRAENSHAYVDLGLSVKWATMNVGANKPEEYGDYFAWGETEPKSYYSWSTYKWCNGSSSTLTKYNTKSGCGTVDNNTQLDLSDDAARANWGGTWRTPTYDELSELCEQCTWIWTSQNGVNGYKVTSKSNGNSIFLPAAGYRYDSSLIAAGSDAHYWSSSLCMDDPNSPDEDLVYNMFFMLEVVYRYGEYRYSGFSVRPVCQ